MMISLLLWFFLRGKQRNIFFSASNIEGRNLKAAFVLVDLFIKKNANTNQILDFAGSMIKCIADFNKGFGAVETQYVSYKVNTLPKLIRNFI